MPTHFEPNTNPNVNKLQLYKYYRKGVVAVSPHQQFDIAIFKSHRWYQWTLRIMLLKEQLSLIAKPSSSHHEVISVGLL